MHGLQWMQVSAVLSLWVKPVTLSIRLSLYLFLMQWMGKLPVLFLKCGLGGISLFGSISLFLSRYVSFWVWLCVYMCACGSACFMFFIFWLRRLVVLWSSDWHAELLKDWWLWYSTTWYACTACEYSNSLPDSVRWYIYCLIALWICKTVLSYFNWLAIWLFIQRKE